MDAPCGGIPVGCLADSLIRGLEACLAGNSRTSARALACAEEDGNADPFLHWARGWLALHFENDVREAGARFQKAALGLEVLSYGPCLRGLLKLGNGYLLLKNGQTLEAAEASREARALGADAAELARAVAAKLLEGKSRPEQALQLLDEAWADDPLDTAQAQLLARLADSEEKRSRYESLARLLASGAALDPRIDLEKKIRLAAKDADAWRDLRTYLQTQPGLDVKSMANAYESAAGNAMALQLHEEAVDSMVKALSSEPDIRRADEAAKLASKTRRYAPVLKALRTLIETLNDAQRPARRIYMAVYAKLSQEAFLNEGIRVVEQAVVLKDKGQGREAAALLEKQAQTLGQPELAVTATLMNPPEKAAEPEPHPVLLAEIRFWEQRVLGDFADWVNCIEYCTYAARAHATNIFKIDYLRYLRGRDPENAGYRAIAVALIYQSGRTGEGIAELKKAAALLENDHHEKTWIPFFAEGRLCRSARDYIAALNDGWKAGIQFPREDAAPVKPPVPTEEDF